MEYNSTELLLSPYCCRCFVVVVFDMLNCCLRSTPEDIKNTHLSKLGVMAFYESSTIIRAKFVFLDSGVKKKLTKIHKIEVFTVFINLSLDREEFLL